MDYAERAALRDLDWIRVMKERGHDPIMDEETGELDTWVCNEGYHNGPGCATCKMSWCHHCVIAGSIEPCSNPVLELVAELETRLLAG